MGETILNILKFLMAIALMPIVIACTLGGYEHLAEYPVHIAPFFKWGLIAFFLTYVFIYQFTGVFAVGQQLMSGLFRFLAPLDQFIAYCIPFYTSLILLVYVILDKMFDATQYSHYFLFFAGFAFAMHVLLVAQDLQQNGANKATYFFTMSLVYIINICVIVFYLDWVSREWTILPFIQDAAGRAIDIYLMVFERMIATT
ncbi:MAG: hypothetical protein Q7S13_06280 [Candidatus Omnitrophota bacterium]|nr:hypothetical protein [Candidatus Omnitrophota bacterium]